MSTTLRDTKCEAHISDKGKVTFDPFDLIEYDEQHETSVIAGRMCNNKRRYTVEISPGRKLTACADHLPHLVDSAVGFWDGALVAVEKIAGE